MSRSDVPTRSAGAARRRPRRVLAAVLTRPGAAVAVAVTALLCVGLGVPAAVAAGGQSARADTRPNIVFVLTDDLDTSLLQYMPTVQALAARGTSFSNYIVADSLCCPSRASIMTGEFPHNTGVRNNGGNSRGGFEAFQDHDDEDRTFALHLHDAGYTTGFFGKYLNGYEPADGAYVPAGWDDWYGLGKAYDSYDYTANDNGTLVDHGSAPSDYLGTVLQAQATSFLDTASRRDAPFLLELASFTPHAPYIPAPADKDTFTDVTAPRGPAWNTLPTDPPAWLAAVPPIDDADARQIDQAAMHRVQAVQSVDRAVAALQQSLEARGELADTVFVFSSDNGLHLGQHRLRPGKLTAYDTDIRVPLIVAGPGIPAGVTTDVLAQNIDLAPTFETLGGVTVPPTVDGTSLVDVLRGDATSTGRARAFVEHQANGGGGADVDPDFQQKKEGVPTSYEAIRGPDWTYVQYESGETEYYDLATDPDQLTNLAGTLPDARLRQLAAQVAALRTCAGSACRTAAG